MSLLTIIIILGVGYAIGYRQGHNDAIDKMQKIKVRKK